MAVKREFSRERLREARDARGLSRMELARKMGLRMESVKHWEDGKNGVSLKNLEALISALDCDPGILFVRRET